jgi:hypothetical protein
MVGDQTQQVGAAGLDLTSVSDTINRLGIGDKRKRNEMMRKGLSDPSAFALQNQSQLQQAQQPTSMLGAGGLQSVFDPTKGESTDINDYDWISGDKMARWGSSKDFSNVNPITAYQGGNLYKKGVGETALQNSYLRELRGDLGIGHLEPYEYNYESHYYTPDNRNTGITNLQDWVEKNTVRNAWNPNPQVPTSVPVTTSGGGYYSNGEGYSWQEPVVQNYDLSSLVSKNDKILNPRLNWGTTGLNYDGSSPVDIVNEAMKGNNITQSQMFSQIYRGNEVIPANPAAGTLGGMLDTLYTSSPIANMFRTLAPNLKMSTQEMDKVAGQVMAQKYYGSQTGGYEPFQMGNINYAPDYLNAVNRYVEDKYGSKLPENIYNSIMSGGNNLASEMGSLRSIQANNSSGFFGDVLPVISTVAKFFPATAPFAYAYDAYNAIENGNPLGLAMAAFGGFGGFDALGGGSLEGPMMDGGNLGNTFAGQVSGFNNSLASSLGISPELAGSILKGGIQGLGSGGGLEGMFRGAASGGLGNLAGGTIAGMTKGQFGDSIAKMAGGAASGGLNSLFNKGDAVAGSLYGGMSGGLHAFLNSVGQNLTPQDNQTNKGLAQVASKLAMNKLRKK